MAKLYAELTSDKGGRKVSKSSNHRIEIDITKDNKIIADITVLPSGNIIIKTYGDGDVIVEN